MKEKLTKFSRGVFQYEKYSLFFSQKTIEIGAEAGKIYEGSFQIWTDGPIPMKGILTKTDHFLKLSETSFSGIKVTIQYQYDATEQAAGETRTGAIEIISNYGEYKIPVVVKAEAPYFQTELGKIRDLFQFANLAKQDWLSALKIFKSGQFARKLLIHDRKNEVLYQSLRKSISKSHAMEEFLISIHKKVRISLTVDKTAIAYTNVAETLEDRVVIYKDNWGYIEIHGETDADFIELERKIVWPEHFIGNSCNLKFLVKPEKLKPGMNVGVISLKTPYQVFRIEVTARGEEAEGKEGRTRNVQAYVKQQANLVTLAQNYLNFRMNHIAVEEYVSEMRLIANEIYETGDKEAYYLLKTHLAVAAGDSMEIEECFQFLESCKDKWKQENVERYAGYLYLLAMKDREPEKIQEASSLIEALYEEQKENWKLFWFLMNVKTEYMEEPRKRFEALQELLRCGVRSSIIYYEASVLYRDYKVFLMDVSEEAIPVMTWMVRENFMTEEVKRQYLMMVSKRKHFYPALYHSLEMLYQQKEDMEVLQVILSMLVRAQKAGKQYFKWYELGVEKQVRILKLYEYYMYSMEEDLHKILPESLLTYFSLECTLHEKKKAFLYANVIQNWEQYDKAVLEGYEEAIHAFAKKELEKHVINSNLAILYEDLCTCDAFDETVKANLPYVMFLQELRCDMPDITGAVVVHGETEQEVYTPIEDGIAQVAIYTDSAQVFLVDRKNNRYAATMEYYLSKYISLDELASECFPYAQENGMLLLYLYEQLETYQNHASTALALRKRILLLEELRPSFYWKCFGKVAKQYYDNVQLAALDELLQTVDFTKVCREERPRLMELCIIRGLPINFEEQFEKYGYDNLPPKRLLAYYSRRFHNKEQKITPVFLNIAMNALKKGRADKLITKMLCNHYVGTLEDLIRIWKSCREFEIPCEELEEQIVSQSLFSETKRPEIMAVFMDYLTREQKDKMVVRAFLSYHSYLYLLKEEELEKTLLDIMKEFILQNSCDIVNLAYLKRLSRKEILTEKEKEYAEIQVQQYVKKGIALSCFMGFQNRISMPYEIAHKYFVEYHCEENRKVVLHYALNGGPIREEVLKNCYQGIFVKKFVLFHGDKLSYYLTEEYAGEKKQTAREEIQYEDDMSDTDSEYGLLNSLLVAKQMQDSKTALDLVKQYVTSKTIVSEQFKMLE
ncbi:DUF5717 family protein [[Clostridium] polysaccharolyticum]|uniref:DUF5717 domain-containing protein n=1 Tax=[Clostridium] polysaccharolyticum TaxID=29364 RepID=A0A1H9Y687_9FIRM|nr:DUF5717 family protein [[Clostridium] polysaccharolyticum]SES64413.1 hypothetical protein SAMN04487772_101169 [[Clostridium] polysaccharolyticum]